MKRRAFLALCSLALYVTLGLFWAPAKAEDCFVINVDLLDMTSLRSNDYVAAHLSAQTSGIRVQKYISDSDELAARVRLTILQVDTNTIIFDKNYGYQSMTFDSGDIYLPYVESRTAPYLVTLYIEDWVYAMPFMHLTPRLSYNGACTFGVRMRDYNPSLTSNWLMGTMLDVNDLRAQGQITLPICASNAFIVGEATVALLGDELTVALDFAASANVELHQIAVYCVGQVAELTSAEPPFMPERAYRIGEGIDISGQTSVLLYVPMAISYDSAGLSGFAYDLVENWDLQRQLTLWNENLQQSFAEIPTELPPEIYEPPVVIEPPIVIEPPVSPPPIEEDEPPASDEPSPTAEVSPAVEPLPTDVSEDEGEPIDAAEEEAPEALPEELS